MNERILELMKQADYPAPELALRAHKLAELIIRECADIGALYADGNYEVYNQIMAHFGLEEQVTEPAELHTCPYAEEIHGDYETLCDCDEEQQYQCRMDI